MENKSISTKHCYSSIKIIVEKENESKKHWLLFTSVSYVHRSSISF